MLGDASEASVQQIEALFRQVVKEEENYNWDKCIELLNEIVQRCQPKKLKTMAGDAHFRLGEINLILAEYQFERSNIFEKLQLSIDNFQKAAEIFKDLKKKEELEGSFGFIIYLKYLMESLEKPEVVSLQEAKIKFNNAKIQAQQNGNLLNVLKMEIFEFRVSFFLMMEKIIRIDPHSDLVKMAHDFDSLVLEVWDKIKPQSRLPEFYFYFFLMTIYYWVPMSVMFLPGDVYDFQAPKLSFRWV